MDMFEDLVQRIDALDWNCPYVWQLRISEAEFVALETAVAAGATTARQNVVYLAEWYKRRYDGGVAKPIRDLDPAKAFVDSGISQANNLFTSESGSKLWQYSIYVLGGVAIPFELGKQDHRFLKELCKLYYGEEGDVDRLGVHDKSRAIAFRESVKRRGSLYCYIQSVLSKDKPFAAEDLEDPDSQVNQFLERIKRANDEVLKSKYALEWIVKFDPSATFMTRKLRLTLKPESMGGLNHQYLKFERVRQWGVVHPEKCRRLVVGARFMKGDEVVAEPNFAEPLLDYSTTGDAASGFVAWRTEKFSRKMDVPVRRFDTVEIVARDDANREYAVERFEVASWMQVFRNPNEFNEWTSTYCLQRDSALVCTEDVEILDEGIPTETYRKRFWVKGGRQSDVYQWHQILDKVSFLTGEGHEIALYNRRGYDQIVAVPHPEILRYYDGRVKYCEVNEDEYTESYLPLLFGRQDLIVRHFESRNDLTEEPDPSARNYDSEKVEFLEGGRYVEWTDSIKPAQGRTMLRVTVKGVPKKFVAFILPLDISRDCDSGKVHIGDDVIEDRIVRDGTPIDPVIHKSLGDEESFVSLEIWRPTQHKEIIRNGRVVKYVEAGDMAEISYALKDGLIIHDFSVSGYKEYLCSQIGNIFALPDFSPVGKNNSIAYEKSLSVNVAHSLDASAPNWLMMNLTSKFEKDSAVKLYYWDFLLESEPREVQDDSQCGRDDVVFHGLADYQGINVLACKISKLDPFSKKGKKIRANLVRCFEFVTRQKAYYFHMVPFKMPNVDLKTELYEPLLLKRGGLLSEDDRSGLRRLSGELGFDWREKYGVVID